MMKDSDLTQAPFPLQLGDRTLHVSPLNDEDITEIDQWLRGRFIANARASCEGLSKEERREAVSQAMSEAMSLTFLSPGGAKMIATLDGMVRLLWQSVKRNHPDVSEKELRHIVRNPENLETFNQVFDELNNKPQRDIVKNGRKARKPRKKKKNRRGSRSTKR